tara:strand:+ start:2105 stop:3415 length:1311 start_codon:yes stop_codon:yes gene_type:complete
MKITKKNIQESKKTLNGPLWKYDELEDYLNEKNHNSTAHTEFIGLKDLDKWDFDSNGNFSHETGRFFKVTGIFYENISSGILLQSDIGTLGVIYTFINGVLHFLIQFQEEPGSLGPFQLFSTIQATKSNYSRVHGGNLPPYWEQFQNIGRENILHEGILSEQGARYYQKYNRNVIIYSEEVLEEAENFKWMTLGQLYKFHNIDNSIASCLRSVLSLLNPAPDKDKEMSKGKNLNFLLNMNKDEYKAESRIQDGVESFYINKTDSIEINSDLDSFSIKAVKVDIKGREVKKWSQPIVVEAKNFEYYLFRLILNNQIYYMWKRTLEPGYSFGFMYGPTVLDTSYSKNGNNLEETLIQMKNLGNVVLNKKYVMSEEGGRFWKSTATHHIYDVFLYDDSLPSDTKVFDKYETHKLLEKGFLSIEARSLLYFSNALNIAQL